jgi:hypothetical protein
MSVQLRLNVDQVSAAILLLDPKEKHELKQRLPLLMALDQDDLDERGWLQLAETAFDFWTDPAEDIYQDLVTAANGSAE